MELLEDTKHFGCQETQELMMLFDQYNRRGRCQKPQSIWKTSILLFHVNEEGNVGRHSSFYNLVTVSGDFRGCQKPQFTFTLN